MSRRTVKKDEAQSKNDYKIKCIELSMLKVVEDIVNIKKNVVRMRSIVDAHINRQYSEIRVVEENGEWGDYSGMFFVDNDDEKDVIVRKAREHFDAYFVDGSYHQDKKFGLFLSSPKSGKQLIEERET